MSLHDVENVLEELAGLPSFHHPTVSPDGSTVAVYYDGSGRNELHLLDTDTGESRRVTDYATDGIEVVRPSCRSSY